MAIINTIDILEDQAAPLQSEHHLRQPIHQAFLPSWPDVVDVPQSFHELGFCITFENDSYTLAFFEARARRAVESEQRG